MDKTDEREKMLDDNPCKTCRKYSYCSNICSKSKRYSESVVNDLVNKYFFTRRDEE